jgi:hypothetical protein
MFLFFFCAALRVFAAFIGWDIGSFCVGHELSLLDPENRKFVCVLFGRLVK